MALPKRRFSRARRDKRRSQQHTAVPTLSRCGQCGAPVAAHRLCPACGYYRGRKVMAVKTAEKAQE